LNGIEAKFCPICSNRQGHKPSRSRLDDFTTYDLTTFTTLRFVIDLETWFTVQKWVSRSIKSRKVVKVVKS